MEMKIEQVKESRTVSALEGQWDRIFWTFFLLASAMILINLVLYNYFDILLSVVVVILGSHKLVEDIRHARTVREKGKILESLDHIMQWLQETHALTSSMKEKTEMRFHRIDLKRARTELDIKKRYDDILKEIERVQRGVEKLKKPRKR